jgi:hypothetical protein
MLKARRKPRGGIASPSERGFLLAAVAVFSNFLAGYNLRSMGAASVRLLLLPLVVSVAFFLIAEIDSPRRGVIQVTPQNLLNLADSLRNH